ncbi:MAG: exonuclease domain-containing protein [Chromatiales bacterium]|jgi:DNA polymerase-3 subunit epsilon
MWPFRPGKQQQREKALAGAGSDVMRGYLSTPLPDRKRDWRDHSVVALDLETTGLDPEQDHILSIGLVEMQHGCIHLDSAWHQIINTGQAVPEETAVIHEITDDQIASGRPLDEVLPELLQRLAGKAMLVHYAFIEQNFINAACMKLYGSPFVIEIIDTLPLAQRRLEMRNHTIQPGNLRLFNLRRNYHLPMYKAHNALYDALATAELFMAMAADISPTGKQKLGDFLS